MDEVHADKIYDQSTVLQDIFTKLDKIMKSQEKIQTRLDTLEQAYLDSGRSEGSFTAMQGTYGQRWTEQEHAVFLKCLETYPRSAAQQIASVVKTKSAK